MCLIAWRWLPGAEPSLTLLANRDEYFARPTAPMARWENADIWAGRDLHAGGTWLGVNRDGRLAALTNYRAPQLQRHDTPSRGDLVKRFLESDMPAKAFIEHIAFEASLYNPFNLLLYDTVDLIGYESRVEIQRCIDMAAGYGNVSNGDFNAPWPKSLWLQEQMEYALKRDELNEDALLDLLLNQQAAPECRLPRTGITLERERALSSPFIRLSDYGTRASSLVYITRHSMRLVERNFDSGGHTHQIEFWIPLIH